MYKIQETFTRRKPYHIYLPAVFNNHCKSYNQPPETFHFLIERIDLFKIFISNGNKSAGLDCFYGIFGRYPAVKGFLRMDNMTLCRYLCIDLFFSFFIIFSYQSPSYKIEVIFYLCRLDNDLLFSKVPDLKKWFYQSIKLLFTEIYELMKELKKLPETIH